MINIGKLLPNMDGLHTTKESIENNEVMRKSEC